MKIEIITNNFDYKGFKIVYRIRIKPQTYTMNFYSTDASIMIEDNDFMLEKNINVDEVFSTQEMAESRIIAKAKEWINSYIENNEI